MARVGATKTFKLFKWTLEEFKKINIKIRGLKENLQNILKIFVSDILIDRLVELEHSHDEFKEQYEDRLKALEAKVTSLNNDIINLL